MGKARKRVTPQAPQITPKQIEIRELKKKLARLEEHNEILKKATDLDSRETQVELEDSVQCPP